MLPMTRRVRRLRRTGLLLAMWLRMCLVEQVTHLFREQTGG